MSRKKVILIFATILCLLVLTIPGYASEKPTCAVLLFHPDTASSDIYESQILSRKFAVLLERLDMFDVIDYNEVSEILKNKNEFDIEKTCTDLGCALKVGNKLNVDFVIYGIIGNVGSLFSLDTTLVNVAGGNETQHAVYDFEGTKEDFLNNAPAENIKSLFGLYEIPAGPEISMPTAPANAEMESEPEKAVTEVSEQPAPAPKKFHIGPRLGIGASNDGIEFGGGFEVQFSKLSFQFMLNTDGFASGFSFYLHPDGNSPFVSVVGSYYDKESHNDEIGRIYGLLLGYRIALDNYVQKDIAKHINLRIGAGVGYVNWDAKPKNPDTKKSDEEFIPVCELTLGYMF